MSTDLPTTIAAIRATLQDNPPEDYLGAAVVDDTATTWTVTTIGLYNVGTVIEVQDGTTGAEQVLVRSVDTANTQVVVKRGHNGSTAVAHANGTLLLIKPRWTYNRVAQAVNDALASDLYINDVFDVVEHQVTSSATSDVYNAPSTSCLKPLDIYQVINTGDEPQHLRNWSKRYTNVDTSLYSNGAYFTIRENVGVAGTALYYVNCAHRLTISTITPSQEPLIHALACWRLLKWEDPKRTAGPTNQGDRTVRPLDSTRLSAAFKDEADRLMRDEAALIKQTLPPKRKEFLRMGRYV